MERNARIYVAGHTGLAGSAIARALVARGYRNLLLRNRAELDLTDRASVGAFFERERPEYVFLAAARAGGILANKTYPAEFIHQNLAIQTSVMDESRRAGVKRLLFLAASCIYPRDARQPMRETDLLTGPVESTSRPYAIAKIAGIEMCWSYNRQYGTRCLVAVPNNLYGPGDNYDPESSHVVAGLIRKFHEARLRMEKGESGKAGGHPPSLVPHPAGNDDTVVLWGSGTPRRELLHSDDMAEACVALMVLPDERFDALLGSGGPAAGSSRHSSLLSPRSEVPVAPLVNIGGGADLAIRDLAERVRGVVGFTGRIEWDTTRPDGAPRKLLDSSRMKALGWSPRIRLEDGLRGAYQDFLGRFGA